MEYDTTLYHCVIRNSHILVVECVNHEHDHSRQLPSLLTVWKAHNSAGPRISNAAERGESVHEAWPRWKPTRDRSLLGFFSAVSLADDVRRAGATPRRGGRAPPEPH